MPDYANFVAIYSRYRITRVIFEFLPLLTTWPQNGSNLLPMIFSWVNTSAAFINDVPATFADQVDDLNSTMHDPTKPFKVDTCPQAETTIDMLPAVAMADGMKAPWIDSSQSTITHAVGQVFWLVTGNGGAPALVSGQFAVFSTAYIDFDSQK